MRSCVTYTASSYLMHAQFVMAEEELAGRVWHAPFRYHNKLIINYFQAGSSI